MSSGCLLILDDEESIRQILAALLKPLNYKILLAASAEEALSLLRTESCDLVLSDLQMEGMGGMNLLRLAREEWPRIRFFLMSAYADLETLAEAMRLGAVDFMNKPLQHQLLREKIRVYMEESLAQNKANLPSPEDGRPIGQSEVMQLVFQRSQKAAQGEATVLVTGESGTGKEVIAHWIHHLSPRKEGPFVAVNCGAIPENLVESELFGHEKGAFTGAVQSKPGKFEMAEGGTLFLDEIGELPLLAQVKILRAIQERRIERVGGQFSKEVNIRLIAATHRDLVQMVQKGSFREDLYYRLNVIPIHLPPLRERGQDILLLARSILRRLNSRYETGFQLSGSDEKKLLQYEWSGNVRELENVLERSLVLSNQHFELILENIKSNSIVENAAEPSFNLAQSKLESERTVLLAALEKTRWNKTQAAELLGMSRRGLLYKLKALEIS